MSADIVRARSGDSAMHQWVADILVNSVAKEGSDGTKKSLQEEIRAKTAELAGPKPSALEQTLAEVAAVNWFALKVHEATYFGSAGRNEMSFRQAEFLQNRIDRSHRRLMSSLKTLATVRKLGVPALQINLARNQINMAGGASGEAD